MAIVIGFDIHREQVTFDALDDLTGEVRRGRISPADRLAFAGFSPMDLTGQLSNHAFQALLRSLTAQPR
jgi:hypothetical protein